VSTTIASGVTAVHDSVRAIDDLSNRGPLQLRHDASGEWVVAKPSGRGEDSRDDETPISRRVLGDVGANLA
jgi:hypothetical protein